MDDLIATGARDQAEPVAEYEREPVPDRALLGFRSFVGPYAGKHTAGTELMIDPLFVASGVAATDVCRRWWHSRRHLMPGDADDRPAARHVRQVLDRKATT